MPLLEMPGWLRSATDLRSPPPPLGGDPGHRPNSDVRDPGDMAALELALLRRSLAGITAATERCDGCHRTMLIGERVYEYPAGGVLCELCRDSERQSPAHTHTVHGPEFGHTIRVVDRRAA